MQKRRFTQRAMLMAAAVFTVSQLAQAQAPTPGAAPPPSGRGPAAPIPAPAADLTGTWSVFANKGTPGRTFTIKQDGSSLSGEMKVGRVVPGLNGSMLFKGTMEGNQFDIIAFFDYQGEEVMHFRGELKDDHLVGKRLTIHTAPHKWTQDAAFDEEYERAK